MRQRWPRALASAVIPSAGRGAGRCGGGSGSTADSHTLFRRPLTLCRAHLGGGLARGSAAARPRPRLLTAPSFSAGAARSGLDGGSQRSGPELISIDCVEVEVLAETSRHASQEAAGGAHRIRTSAVATAHGQKGSGEHVESAGASATAAATADGGGATRPEVHRLNYWDVDRVDPFARSRVTNFVRRSGNAHPNVFDVRHEEMEGRRVCVASCRLVLPEPHRLYVAEGVADSHKDAEVLAAMHAERVCDALGVPLFRLPSMQRRHAEAARAEGRDAPMPGDAVRPEGTPVPPPLRMIASALRRSSSTGVARGSQDHANAPSAHGLGGATTVTDAAASAATIPSAEPLRETGPQSAPRLFAVSVAEAELVGDGSRSTRHATDGGMLVIGEEEEEDAAAAAAAAAAKGDEGSTGGLASGCPAVKGCAVSTAEPEAAADYLATAWLPWRERPSPLGPEGWSNGLLRPAAAAPHSTGADGASRAAARATEAALSFDPTEGGLWRMVNTTSTRCSPTPLDALVLPCVYEPPCVARVTDYFLQHGCAIASRTTATHVAVPGSHTRMFVVEMALMPSAAASGLLARGKGSTREVAMVLAAMHAELLLDALGLPVFPKDAPRQRRHARAAASFGRWAPGAVSGLAESPPDPFAPLPLPLKQQVGGDEVWLDPAMMRRANAHTRTDGDRIIAAMNELNTHCGDCVEVNPPEEWLAESVDVLRQWQTNVARSPFPELYVITGMGDFYRATTLTPVPHAHGVRGGNAVGRTIAQAVQLCAMHAVDSLCALGIPLYADPLRQRAFLARRRLFGRVTHAEMRGMTRPKGLVSVLKPSIAREERSAPAGQLESAAPGSTPSGASEDAALSLSSPSREPCVDPAGAAGRQPYLPGYIIEGSVQRLPPPITDTLAILQLRIPEDFEVCGAAAEDLLVAIGNDVKTCLQNYLRHQHECRRASAPQMAPPSAACAQDDASHPSTHTRGPLTTASAGAGGEQQPGGREKEEDDISQPGADEREKWRRWLANYPLNVLPSIYITGYGKQVSVHNIAYLRLPRPPRGGTQAAPARRTPESASGGDAAAAAAPPGETPQPEAAPAPRAGDSGASAAAGPAGTGAGEPPLLAVGISLKKKDAERACYIHAAALLRYHDGLDVLRDHRAGLPRQGSVASLDDVLSKLLPAAYGARVLRAPGGATTEADRPKPLMSAVMRRFIDSGVHHTAPRKRPPAGPFNPF